MTENDERGPAILPDPDDDPRSTAHVATAETEVVEAGLEDLNDAERDTLIALHKGEPLPEDGFWLANLSGAGMVDLQEEPSLTDLGAATAKEAAS
jgi:hypothetical protein